MAYDFSEFQRLGQALRQEHQEAIEDSETAARKLAKAEAEYHKQLAVAVARLRPEGATVAETLAKGCQTVIDAREQRDNAAGKDRAAMEKIRLCRDDRAVLLTLGAWSKAQEGWEQ